MHAFDHQAKALLAHAKLLFGLFTARQVTGDLQEASDLAAILPQSGDNDVCPEAGTILADAPALVLEAAGGGRHAQLMSGPA